MAEFQYFQAARRHEGDQQRQADEMEVNNVSKAPAFDDWAMWTEVQGEGYVTKRARKYKVTMTVGDKSAWPKSKYGR